jgi:hypothetical protein
MYNDSIHSDWSGIDCNILCLCKYRFYRSITSSLNVTSNWITHRTRPFPLLVRFLLALNVRRLFYLLLWYRCGLDGNKLTWNAMHVFTIKQNRLSHIRAQYVSAFFNSLQRIYYIYIYAEVKSKWYFIVIVIMIIELLFVNIIFDIVLYI